MENEEELNIRSESIQDIIGTNPPRLVRWGNTFLFLICAIFLSLCWLIKYPDVINSQITIKTDVVPKPVTVQQEGKLIKLFVKDGEQVKKGQVLGYMESLASVEDIMQLEIRLKLMDTLIALNNWDLIQGKEFSASNRFGELQTAFENFYISFQTLHAYMQGSIVGEKKKIIANELLTYQKLFKNLNEQEKEIINDLKLAEEEYKTNLKLYSQNVISLVDLRAIESKYISKKIVLKQLQTNKLTNDNYRNTSSKQLADIVDNVEQEKIGLIKQLNILKSELLNWKRNYVLIAPDNGKLTFAGSINEYETFTKNHDLFYIMPADMHYIGEIYIDQYNLGKVESGQTVIIKLKSYPFEEFGVVKGVLETISEVDVNKQYLIRVKLPEGIKTNLYNDLKFRYGMLGDSEIITKNTMIIDKVIYKLKRTGG